VNKLTFYEQVGIVIPGAVLLTGLLFYFPALNALVAKDGVTLGQFGIFLLLSYAAGHLLAAVGNGLELLWNLTGGMPTDWVTKSKGTGLLTAAQIQAVAAKGRSRLGWTIEKIPGMARKIWFPMARQIYADDAKNGKPDRIDTFNGNYGLNRGLTASMLGLVIIAALSGDARVAGGFLVLAIVYGYRAFRFGRHYGRELYLQFLVLPDGTTAAVASTIPT
jgi:hypothetical protein